MYQRDRKEKNLKSKQPFCTIDSRGLTKYSRAVCLSSEMLKHAAANSVAIVTQFDDGAIPQAALIILSYRHKNGPTCQKELTLVRYETLGVMRKLLLLCSSMSL